MALTMMMVGMGANKRFSRKAFTYFNEKEKSHGLEYAF